MKRREIRESAFILVFESLFRSESANELIDIAVSENTEEIPVNDDVKSIFKGIIENHSELDHIIEIHSEKRQLDRIPKISVAVLRMALYEILYCERIPTNVAISEAVLLSKKYAQEADVVFINGVLGVYSRAAEATNKIIEHVDETEGES